MLQKFIVATLFMSGALLAAHLIKTLLSQITEQNKAAEVQPIVAVPDTADVNYEQLAEEILASEVFDSRSAPSQATAVEGSETGTSTGTAGSKPDEPPIDAASKIRLIGTAAGTRPLGRAVVEDVSTKKQALYHLYDLVPNVGEIVDIREESILIRRGRKEELLELQNVKRAPPQGGQSGTPATESPAPVMN